MRQGREEGAHSYFETACCYSQYRWLKGQPARAVLALLRAIYLDPEQFENPVIQPYRAYRWFLANRNGQGFLGNPRISFAHQATRFPESAYLHRHRAWALWYLTQLELPDLPPDPKTPEIPPCFESLVGILNEKGHPGEGECWRQAMQSS